MKNCTFTYKRKQRNLFSIFVSYTFESLHLSEVTQIPKPQITENPQFQLDKGNKTAVKNTDRTNTI